MFSGISNKPAIMAPSGDIAEKMNRQTQIQVRCNLLIISKKTKAKAAGIWCMMIPYKR